MDLFVTQDATVEMPPPPNLLSRIVDGATEYLVLCPWCQQQMDWCISWIAAWAELAEHYGRHHRPVQEALKRSR